MKRLLLLFLLVFACYKSVQAQAKLDSLAGSIDALNEKYGFRDATFEKPVTAFKNLVLLRTDGRQKTYTRSTDKLKIGDFAIVSILYTFYDGQLSTIGIPIVGPKNVEGIIRTMTVAYGAPESLGSSFTWTSNRVGLTIAAADGLERATLIMLSVPLVHRQNEQKRIDAEKQKQGQRRAAQRAVTDL